MPPTNTLPSPGGSPITKGTPRTVIAPTGVERKVDSVLLEVLATYRQRGRAEAEQLARESGVLGNDDIVRLTLVLSDANTAPVADKVAASGGKVLGVGDNIVEVGIPLEVLLTYLGTDGRTMIADLAAFDSVREIRLTPMIRVQEAPPARAELRRLLAPVTSEGVKVIGADRWQAVGYYGQGVRVGIIDPGFFGYEGLIGGELPPPERVTFRSFASTSADNEPHGTAIAEIITDIVPDVTLFLARIDSSLSLDRAMRWLVDDAKVQVVSMSFGTFGYYRSDGSSPEAKVVDYAFSKGVLCVVSAGNNAEKHYAAPFADADGDGYHDFAPGQRDLRFIPSSNQLEIVLNWEAWTGPAIDLNLEVYDNTGKLLRASTSVQTTGGRSPVESVTVATRAGQAVFVRVKAVGDPGAVTLQLYSRLGQPEIATAAGTIGTPGDARFALAVGATYWKTDQLERYSSQGPTADGRIKPDLAAPSVVSTASYGQIGEAFAGTSAAAPHAAGAAALFLSANPGATAEQIVQFLWSRALDLPPAGNDNQTGRGRIRMGDPPAAPAPPRPTADPRATVAPTATRTPTSARPPTRDPRATGTVTPSPRPGTPIPSPTATATPLPPTPTRPPLRGTPGIPFSDPLGEPGGGLPVGEEVRFDGGQYRIAPNGPNRAAWATYGALYADARIAATAQFATATPGAAGVIFWHASAQDYYLFAITSDGYYQVGHFQDGRWAAVVPWTKSAAIVAGGPNRLLVETTGAQVVVSVNDQRLATVADPGGGGGAVGLLAASFDQPGTVVGFTQFSVGMGP